VPTGPHVDPGDSLAGRLAAVAGGSSTGLRGSLPRHRFWLGGAAVLALGVAGAVAVQLPSGSGGRAGSAAPAPASTSAIPPVGDAVPPPTPPLQPTPTPPFTPAATATAPSGPGATAPAAASPTRAASSSASPTPAQQSPAPGAAGGFLTVRTGLDTSNPYWSQSTVTVTLAAPVSSLKVAVRISQTGGVADTGTWTTIGSNANVAVRTTSTAVNYEFTLAPGATLGPGRYVFAVQYNHDPSDRSVAHDLYAVVAVASGTGAQQGTGGHY
jgi:hypothetical protein